MKPGVLYLIPTYLNPLDGNASIPTSTLTALRNTKYFLVERAKTARSFIKKALGEVDFDTLVFEEIGKRGDRQFIDDFLMHIHQGHDIGLISEAGAPAVADPGTDIVYNCHQQGITVKPLVGPSSILLALMASGLPGQRFRFHGYLPIKNPMRKKAIKRCEQEALQHDETQLFIETPYRNMALFEDLMNSCNAKTKLSICANLTADSEYCLTLPIEEWRQMSPPKIHKIPAVFLLR